MLGKLIKLLFIVAIVGGISLVGGYFAARYYTIKIAQTKAQEIIVQAGDIASPDEEVIALAKTVFERFQEREPSEVWQLRLRPYVTNARLPESIKFPEGAIETIIQQGMCDNAARMLKFVLAQKGYNSIQWNMVSQNGNHSGLQVTLPEGRKGFIDPYYGYGAMKEGKLISLDEAKAFPVEDVLIPLGPNSQIGFYKDLKDMAMAAQGETLHITANLPPTETALWIGEINGNAEDVKSKAGALGMTYYWDYMGHKYNREWVRELTVAQDVRFEMILLDQPEEGILTADPKPQVEGKTLRWDLKVGDKIMFHDGLAQISWKRMNSYIGVDQIVITPVNGG